VAVDAAEAPDVRALSTFATSLGLPERPAEAEAPEERARRPVEGRRRVARLRRMLRDAAPQAVRAQARREMADPRLARRRAELMTIVAESYAAEQRYREAVTAYARVWQGPRSTTAGNALVAAADLALLRLSEPRRARGLYERYLREYPQGPLREVAAAGRCRALHATGATEATRRCVASYARRYPDGRFRGVVDALGER
jgi:tetratricopeptide (TPR) repeat protein